MVAPALPLRDLLARRTREGDLYERLPEGRVRCFACGHRCLIPPGHDGICRVRFNDHGTLRVPHGYVAALQVDPVEKKPFFHALPGSRALSFGMLGCDYHCGYCFTGDTTVVTDSGPVTFEQLFSSCESHQSRPDAQVGLPTHRYAATATGRPGRIAGVARHRYRGELVVVQPFYLAPVRCTPDHRVFATDNPSRDPGPVRAGTLRPGQYLAMPSSGAVGEAAIATAAANLGSGVISRAGTYYIPVRRLDFEGFDGHVYNMEVEEEHSYLAGFLAVSNCQNWVTSQALRDPAASAPAQDLGPAELVRLARKHDARIMTSTYNEPLITSEWAIDVFREARRAGLVCSYVSNGNGTPEVLDYIRPYVSLYKVDLKGFRDRSYRELGGVLKHVQWTIAALVERGFWVEVVTLIVPGFNDSDEELREMAAFLASVSRDIPWHVTAFHQDYKMTDPPNTTVAALLRAAEIGAAEGLRFVYAGNLPGRVGRWENTYCPSCGELLIERFGFRILRDRIPDGTCPRCATRVPGFWEPEARALGAGR
ncbi:MAG TPA: radical SAM protein [Vicinamibacteria bacterium]|nr:radical SAM protein [Vicinamibacteria bacterium]